MGKSDLVFKLWGCVSYSPIYKCCGNCDRTLDIYWDNVEDRVCNVLGNELTFPINESGICKLHSSFKPGSIKWA